MALVALFAILGTGALGYYMSGASAERLKQITAVGEPKTPVVKGYCEPSNEVVDPMLLRSDAGRHPIVDSEVGPFGVPRNNHLDIGQYTFPTFGRPGLWTA